MNHRVNRVQRATGFLLSLLFVAGFLCFTSPSFAAAWMPTTSAIFHPGPIIPGPADVPGKDFSDHTDRNETGLPDPEQVIAWDGKGGVRDSFDYEGSRLSYPEVNTPKEVDALANGGDALFDAVIDNKAALLFSVGETNHTGPDNAFIYFEAATSFGPPPMPSGIWAKPVMDIDSMTPPFDVDGLEVWGDDNVDDSDFYSLYGDPRIDIAPMDGTPETKVAVWKYTAGGAPVSDPAFFTKDLAEAMDKQFGGPGDGDLYDQLVELMDVDATMVNGDHLLFSIAPLTLSTIVPILPDFDGGEIFVYDGPGTVTHFLDHGGHLWDTAFPVALTFGPLGVTSENINALEAVAVPEPSGLVLLMCAAGLWGFCRKSR